MIIVENDVIYINKGDDAVLEVNIASGDGSYELQAGDRLTLTVRELPEADSPVLLQVENATQRIVLCGDDTKDIEVGKYSADVQLTTADGKRITVFPELEGSARSRVKNWGNFVVMPEVTTE